MKCRSQREFIQDCGASFMVILCQLDFLSFSTNTQVLVLNPHNEMLCLTKLLGGLPSNLYGVILKLVQLDVLLKRGHWIHINFPDIKQISVCGNPECFLLFQLFSDASILPFRYLFKDKKKHCNSYRLREQKKEVRYTPCSKTIVLVHLVCSQG